jgi:hypothetical protein
VNNVVQPDLGWYKSSFSGDSGCIEVAQAPHTVYVRDSKDEASAILNFSPTEWASFISAVRHEEFGNSLPR